MGVTIAGRLLWAKDIHRARWLFFSVAFGPLACLLGRSLARSLRPAVMTPEMQSLRRQWLSYRWIAVGLVMVVGPSILLAHQYHQQRALELLLTASASSAVASVSPASASSAVASVSPASAPSPPSASPGSVAYNPAPAPARNVNVVGAGANDDDGHDGDGDGDDDDDDGGGGGGNAPEATEQTAGGEVWDWEDEDFLRVQKNVCKRRTDPQLLPRYALSKTEDKAVMDRTAANDTLST